MEFVNFASDEKNHEKEISKKTVETFLVLIAPLAPHFAEELWSELGHGETVFGRKWPEFEDELTKSDTVTVVVQINGKVRDRFDAPAGSPQDELEKQALNLEKVKKHTEGKDIKKVIVIPDKLVNIVAS